MKRKVKVPIEDYESIDELIDPKQPKFDLNNVQSLKTHGYWSHSSSTNNNDSGSKENQVVIDLSKEDDENGEMNSINIPATNNRIPTTTTSNSHQAISNNNDNVERWRETFKQPASKPPLPIPSSSTSSNNIISDDYLFYKPGVVTVPSLPVTATSNRSALSRDQLPSLTSIHSYDHKSSSNNYHGDQTRSSDFYQQNGFYSKKKTYSSSSSSSSLDDILDDEDVLRKESWDPTKQLDTSTSVYTDGALMYDVTALDVGYEKLTEKLRDGPSSEAAFKSKTPAFDIRQAMMVDTESVKPSGSSSSSSFLVSSHLALAALESSAQHNESMRLADSMQEVNIDSLYRRLLSRPLDAILSYSETDTEKPHTHSSTATSNHSNYNSHNKIMNTGSAIERPGNNKYALPVLSSPRIRFLNESQYVQYFEDRQLREVLAATASHLRTLRITAIGSSTQRGNGTAGKAHRHGGAAYIEAQVYETAHLITQCIQVTEHKACSRPQVTNTSSSISSSSSSSQLMEVEFGSRFESGHGSSVHSVGRRDVRAEGSVLKDDLVLIIRHHKVDANGIDIKGRRIQSLKSLGSYRHLLGVVLEVSHASDTAVNTTTGHARQPSTSATRNDGVTDKIGDLRYRVIVFDHFSDSDAPAESTRLCMRLREGAEYSILPLMALTTFTREWAALQCVRLQNLMLLTPYILKAAPVVSASRLEELTTSVEAKMRTLEQMLTSSAQTLINTTYSRVDSHRTRIEDTFSALEQLLCQLDSIQIDGSVLKKTGIVQTLTKLKRDDKFLRCKDAASSLIKKWKEQVVADNQYSTLKSMQGGNIVAVPDTTSSVDCPSSAPSRLWRRLCASYNNSQLFAIKYVCDKLDDTQDTRVALIQGPPGTGKTSTILAMVASLLHKKTQSSSNSGTYTTDRSLTQDSMGSDALSPAAGVRPVWSHRNRLLICAPSNSAVDELLLRITKGVLGPDGEVVKVKVVRMGEPLDGCAQGIRELSLEYQTEEIVKRSPLWISYTRCAAAIQSTYEKLDTLSAKISHLNSTSTGSNDKAFNSNNQLKYQVNDEYSRKRLPETEREKVHRQLRDARFDLRLLQKERTEIFLGLDRLRAETRRDLIYEAQVVVATLSGSGKQIFIDHIIRDDLRFETIIIDEAAQATEPSTLIPLRYGCRRLVLVGDPRQLPATVLSPTAQKAGLGVSLFERLENAGHPVVLLFVQYRMHPSIRLFPSQHFYQSRLVDHPSVLHIRNLSTSLLHTANNANLLSGIVSTNNLQQVISSNALFQPVAFFDLPSRELSEGTSFRNDDEAELVLAILQALWNLWLETSSLTSSSTSLGTDSVSKCDKSRCNHNLNHPSALSIGIISSYKAQVNSIKNRLIDIIPDSALSSLPDQPFFSRRQIEVNTVDGFQGKEKDIIIFSCVRTSTHGIGFLADERRINVAITRAKQQLIIVGRAQALWEGSDTWRALISSLQNRNFIHKVHA